MLHGLGGIGKTQIAIEYAYRHQKEFDIICWLRADDYNTLISSYIQLANNPTFKSFANLNFNDKPNHEAIAKRVQMWFENTVEMRWLLILDNADSLGSYDHQSDISPPRSKSFVMKVKNWFQKHTPKALKFKPKKETDIQIEDSRLIVARNTLMNNSNKGSSAFKALGI